MYRLASILTALWLSSAAGHPGIGDMVGNMVEGYKKMVVNELQTVAAPFWKNVASFGSNACQGVKHIAGVAYDDYKDEPDMSKLNVVLMTNGKTIIYDLSTAAEEIPKDSWFDPSCPLFLFIHGFTDDPSKSGFQTMRAAFDEVEKSEGKVNILALDASSLIKFYYLRASTMVRFIGENLGAAMANMMAAGLKPENIRLIGHSLGSHIAGFAGQQFYKLTGLKVGRITGLDPAGPCFSSLDDNYRLSPSDAEFVVIIHTNAGVLGMTLSMGHADFWPNSGSAQSGCLMDTCSHSRAWEYYAESVPNREAFQGVRCSSWDDFRHGLVDYNYTSVMGYATPNTTRGNYCLITYDKAPYGGGEDGLVFRYSGIIRTAYNFFKDVGSFFFSR